MTPTQTSDCNRDARASFAGPTGSVLSEADRYALGKLPEGWFELHQVPFMVKNPRWRCDRLAEKGALESKTEPYAPEGCCGLAYRNWWRNTPNTELSSGRTP